ncbi:glycosyltransferase family 2 protein [Flavobacteriaceae bacterium 14752]|uniref:glycosyltransferase family 2 protein n=1 Tax=Mesohalobacter salilacus TaxID=2491711 RepID=UPI000F63193A|nr:glycosyltransferase family 2 protein [Flavobacteriaceae bacterium 14752]
MSNPKVSIIVPNYNHAQFLEQRLESVFNQTFQNFEVILLDDCSTDHSIEILNQYKTHPKVSQAIFNQKNSGSPFKQWQKGISLAQGEYIWIAESDDYCEYIFLEKLVNKSSDFGLKYTQSYDVDDSGQVIFDRIMYTSNFKKNIWISDFKISGNEFVDGYLLIKNVIPNASATIFKKNLVNDDLFSNKLLNTKMCGDWWFWIHIAMQTKVYFNSSYLNYFRNHKTTTRTHDTSQKLKTRLLEEAMLRSDVYRRYRLKNSSKENALLKRWFKHFKFYQILSTEFKSIKMRQISWLYLYFIYFKIKLL